MKRKLQLITSASAASLMTFATLAQEAPGTKKGGTEIDGQSSTLAVRAERLGRADKASELIGMMVKSYDNEELGKVNDFAVDLETGRLVQVILSTGGLLGFSAMLVPVPPGALDHDAARKVIHLKSDRVKLKAAPRYGMSNWANLGQSNQVAEVYRYHGQQPYFAAAYQPALGPDPTARLGYVQRTTQLMGVSVRNVQKESLGKVADVMVDLSAGRVVAVILSSGGLFGMGEALCAVPPAAFQFNSEQRHLQLDVSKEAMSKAPHFEASKWPDLGEPSYVGGVYRAYRVEPYFITNSITGVDKTARNVRGFDTRRTILEQGDSQADVDTTTQIRNEIVAGKSMSANARNVKIITNRGRVTLRGPVNSAEEMRVIGEIANRIARAGYVDNQLEVKLTSSAR